MGDREGAGVATRQETHECRDCCPLLLATCPRSARRSASWVVRLRLHTLPDAPPRPGSTGPPSRHPRQPARPHCRSRTRRLARRDRRTSDQPRRSQNEDLPTRGPAGPHRPGHATSRNTLGQKQRLATADRPHEPFKIVVQRTSKTWQVNAGWVLAANIAADIDAWTRLLGLHDHPDVAHAEPQTLRYRLWHLPGKLVEHTRRRTLKISPTWPWAEAFTTCWNRLGTLPAPN